MTVSIISLTTIPPRMHRLGPTLESLLQQKAPIDAIIIWIPKTYRRPEFGAFILPKVPQGVEIRRCDTDYGPATKIIPAIQAFRHCDARILYCDDDRIYDPEWASRLIDASETLPQACVTEAGEPVHLTILKAIACTPLYRFLNSISHGLTDTIFRSMVHKLEVGACRVDICKGYGGVLVRPSFFRDSVYEIPDILWTVDDIWLSGHLAVNQIPIFKVGYKTLAAKRQIAEISPLERYTYEGYDRHEANLACIRYFKRFYGIWNGRSSRKSFKL